MVSTGDSKSLSLSSNLSGAAFINMDNIVQSLKEHAEKALEYIQIVDKEVRAKHLENEQWFINWQDKLNVISVK